jgi:hypothetical protein
MARQSSHVKQTVVWMLTLQMEVQFTSLEFSSYIHTSLLHSMDP